MACVPMKLNDSRDPGLTVVAPAADTAQWPRYSSFVSFGRTTTDRGVAAPDLPTEGDTRADAAAEPATKAPTATIEVTARRGMKWRYIHVLPRAVAVRNGD